MNPTLSKTGTEMLSSIQVTSRTQVLSNTGIKWLSTLPVWWKWVLSNTGFERLLLPVLWTECCRRQALKGYPSPTVLGAEPICFWTYALNMPISPCVMPDVTVIVDWVLQTNTQFPYLNKRQKLNRKKWFFSLIFFIIFNRLSVVFQSGFPRKYAYCVSVSK